MFLAAGALSAGVAAAQDGPLLKLLKPAKLHAAAAASSAVVEIIWKDATCVWLDKQSVWVKVRSDKDGQTGWIHQDYLAPAVTSAQFARKMGERSRAGL